MKVLVTDGTAHRGCPTCVALPTAGQDITPADFVDVLYGNIITKGAHKTHAIKVIEQAKIIESTQCDLSIVMANDLAMLLKKYGIDILDVLEADGTKSNFLPFHLGLVGGHGLRPIASPDLRVYDATGLAVGHDEWGGPACVRQTAMQRGLQRKARAATRCRRRAVVTMQLSPNSTCVGGGFANGVSSAANASSDEGIQRCHFGNGCVKSGGLDWEPSR